MRRHKVLLAAHSPIYAPLYLAKQCKFGSFAHVDFEYRPVHQGRGDPLVRDVLSHKLGDDRPKECIAAVCDPFRALIRPGPQFDTPLILGGLVQHMAYYLVDHEAPFAPDCEQELPNHFDKIVVHPKYMTGYALMRFYLNRICPNLNYGDLIHSDTFPGFEQYQYEKLQKTRNKKGGRHYAFLTTNPMFIWRTKHETKSWFVTSDLFRDRLMTSLVVGTESYARERETIDGLIEGVQRAIEIIREDPFEAAYRMRQFDDPLVPFSFWTTDIVHLERALAHLHEVDVFPSGCTVAARHLDRGVEMRQLSRAENPDHTHLLDYAKLIDFFDPRFLDKSPPPAAVPATVAKRDHPEWIKKEIRDYARSHGDSAKEVGGAATAFATAAALLASCSAVLLSPPVVFGLPPSSARLNFLDGSFGTPDWLAMAVGVCSIASMALTISFWARRKARKLSSLTEFLFIGATIVASTTFMYAMAGPGLGGNWASAATAAGALFFVVRHPDFLPSFWRGVRQNSQEFMIYCRIIFSPIPPRRA